MKIFYTDSFVLPLSAGHRFPKQKYSLLRERLVASGVAGGDRPVVPPAAGDHELCLVQDAGYVQAVSNGRLDAGSMRRIGFPWSTDTVDIHFHTVAEAARRCSDGATITSR